MDEYRKQVELLRVDIDGLKGQGGNNQDDDDNDMGVVGGAVVTQKELELISML